MASILQSSMGLLRSRLSRRIVFWVFFSLLVIEGIIFVPSFYRRYREKLRGLEAVSQEALFTVKSRAMDGMLGADLIQLAEVQLRPDSVIRGGVLYQVDGTLVGSFGEMPEISLENVPMDKAVRKLRDNRTIYDVAWPSEQFLGQYVFMVRHDASQVRHEMVQYALAIAGLVILISIFVTFATILVLERILINPLLRLRDDLLAAGEAVSREQVPDFYSLSMQRSDELGEVAIAFQQMFQRVQQEIHDRQLAQVALQAEQDKSERLLRNMLPASIAEQLKRETGAIASRFDEATILFADIVDFTGLSASISPTQLVKLLNEIFSTFDNIADRLGLEKIKTIGDAYMVVGGLPMPREDHAEAIMAMAIEMQRVIRQFQRQDGQHFCLRIGINTGPVVAGVIGIKKFSYDLWGNAVNIASRLESHGIPDRIQVSESAYQRLQSRYTFECRGEILIKGLGPMMTYLYSDPTLH